MSLGQWPNFPQPQDASRQLGPPNPERTPPRFLGIFLPSSTKYLFIDVEICMEKGLEGNTRNMTVFIFFFSL